MNKVLCLRAGEPRPYLDKKFYVVQVGAWSPRPSSYFPQYHKYRRWISEKEATNDH
jgi:hypothetical protein